MARSRYVQTTLLPPEVVEATLRLGTIGASNHVQVQCEIRNPVDGELLALWSRPHAPLSDLHDVLALAAAELEQAVRELLSPF